MAQADSLRLEFLAGYQPAPLAHAVSTTIRKCRQTSGCQNLQPVFLSVQHVFLLYEEQLVRFGGAAGIRDLGLLKSAFGMPQIIYSLTRLLLRVTLLRITY